jgi:UDP-glucose 4-epimerase
MKKILITGADSYIGTSFESWIKKWRGQYQVDTIDMKDSNWRKHEFSEYDVVFCVAGIAHVDTRKASKELQDLYFKINRDLVIEVAQKAKKDGVKQFVFMSSIIVYGDSSPIGVKKVITKDTAPKPSNFYGESKLQAEQGILPMQSDDFNVVVLRPPIIYGKGSKGNYPKLAAFARKYPIFPYIENERSMLHIDNLCEFIRLLIDDNAKGIYYPQNREYVRTSELVKTIAEVNGKAIKTTRIFNPLLYLLKNRVGLINKVFGNLVYDKELSNYKDMVYCVRDFRESIISTEREE